MIIKGLYETHLQVQNLERAVQFYTGVLGLAQCYYDKERRIAFFWIGKPKQAMLGLWETAKVNTRHFAFECDPQWILKESVSFLKSRNLKCRNFLNNTTERPMVFAWMPAISIYFDDPDGNELEFIGMLSGDSKPEKGILSYEEWILLEKDI